MLLLVAIILWILGIIISEFSNNKISESIGVIVGFIAFLLIFPGITLIGSKGDNREEFFKKQQEYIVLNQYVKSDKSDSILESEKMLNKVMEYNDFVIKKQNDMTRPIKKYWTEGANWNELKLINLKEINIEEEK